MAALLSGFCLCTRSSAAERSCGNIRRRAHVILCCTKAQLHQPAEDKGNPNSSNQNTKPIGKPVDTSSKKRPTKVKKMMVSRPIHEKDVCSFHFSIYMVSEDAIVDAGRWFLSTTNVNPSTCSWHCGHKRLDPSLLPNQISNMSEDEQELAKQCLQLHVDSVAMGNRQLSKKRVTTGTMSEMEPVLGTSLGTICTTPSPDRNTCEEIIKWTNGAKNQPCSRCNV
ncbi:hypothetical protein IV203_024288 [Nitzschia inconspicua]|uniref:Uncharacterized protein n=1 Tax=Nitzschia inconspicua TaxID=303405 RepID=A0A9K3KBR0_9STRA|nr:hypothetical protein IV203_024288 [Nitzschia inconspicua]